MKLLSREERGGHHCWVVLMVSDSVDHTQATNVGETKKGVTDVYFILDRIFWMLSRWHFSFKCGKQMALAFRGSI